MGSGPYGLETLRDKFDGHKDSKVMLIFDVWKAEGSTDRTQVRLPYMNIEDVVEKYGDFVYDGWYTEGSVEDSTGDVEFKDMITEEIIKGRYIGSLWAMADEKRRVDPDLYENWPKLWEGNE